MNESLPKGRVLYKMVYCFDRFVEETACSNILDMKRIGSAQKIDFRYSGFIGNTLDSHRLIWKAVEEGGSNPQDRVV